MIYYYYNSTVCLDGQDTLKGFFMRSKEPFNYRIEPNLKKDINSLAREQSHIQDRNVPVTELLEEALTDILKKYNFKKNKA